MQKILVVCAGGAGLAMGLRIRRALGGGILSLGRSSHIGSILHPYKELVIPPTEKPQLFIADSSGSLIEAMADYEKIIIVAGLGGTIANVAPNIAHIAQSTGKHIIAAVTLPHSSEPERQALANTALEQLLRYELPTLVHDHASPAINREHDLLNPLDTLAAVADYLTERLRAELETSHQSSTKKQNTKTTNIQSAAMR